MTWLSRALLGLLVCLVFPTTHALAEPTPEAAPSEADAVPTTADDLSATGWQPRAPCHPALGEVVADERDQWAIRCDGHTLWRMTPPSECRVCEPLLARDAVWTVQGTDLLRHEFEDAGIQERHRFPGRITDVDVDGDRIRVTAEGEAWQRTWELPDSGWLMLPLPLERDNFKRLHDEALDAAAVLLNREAITLETLSETLRSAEPATLARLESGLMVHHYQDRTNPWMLHLVAHVGFARGPTDAVGHVEEAMEGLRNVTPAMAYELLAMAPHWLGVDDAFALELLDKGVRGFKARGFRPEAATSQLLWALVAGPPPYEPSRNASALRLDLHQALFPRLPHSQRAATSIAETRLAHEPETEALRNLVATPPPRVGYRGFDIPGPDAPLWLLPLLPAGFLAWWLAWLARATRPSGAATLLERRATRSARLLGRAWPVAERMGMVMLCLVVLLASWTGLRTVSALEAISSAPHEVFSGFVEHPRAATWWQEAPETEAVEAMRASAEGPDRARVCDENTCSGDLREPTLPDLSQQREAWRDLARERHPVRGSNLLTSALLPLPVAHPAFRSLAALAWIVMLLLSLLLLVSGMGQRGASKARSAPAFCWLPGSAPRWGVVGPFITLLFMVALATALVGANGLALHADLLPAGDPLLGQPLEHSTTFPPLYASAAALTLVAMELALWFSSLRMERASQKA